jgi:hypothetical protein
MALHGGTGRRPAGKTVGANRGNLRFEPGGVSFDFGFQRDRLVATMLRLFGFAIDTNITRVVRGMNADQREKVVLAMGHTTGW